MQSGNKYYNSKVEKGQDSGEKVQPQHSGQKKRVVADRDMAAGERLKAKLLVDKSWEKPRACRPNQRLAEKEELWLDS